MPSVNHAELLRMISQSCTYRLSCGSQRFGSGFTGLSEITTALRDGWLRRDGCSWSIDGWSRDSCSIDGWSRDGCLIDGWSRDGDGCLKEVCLRDGWLCYDGLPSNSWPNTELWLDGGTGISCCSADSMVAFFWGAEWWLLRCLVAVEGCWCLWRGLTVVVGSFCLEVTDEGLCCCCVLWLTASEDSCFGDGMRGGLPGHMIYNIVIFSVYTVTLITHQQ